MKSSGKTSPKSDRSSIAAHPDSHRESLDGPPPRPEEGLLVSLGRYLVSSYLPTLMHALFHLMAVLLAFIIGTVWAAREADLRDIRAELAVLRPLAGEATRLKDKSDILVKNPPEPCADGFTVGIHEESFKIPLWSRILSGEQAFVIDQAVFDKVQVGFKTLGEAVETSKSKTNIAQCRNLAEDTNTALVSLKKTLDDRVTELQTKQTELKRGFRPEGLMRYVLLALVAWVLVILVPPGIYTAGVIRKRRGKQRRG